MGKIRDKEGAIRRLVRDRIDEYGYNYSELSRHIGKNHAYIQQYLKRCQPRWLPEDVRMLLAPKLGLSPEDLTPYKRAAAERISVNPELVSGGHPGVPEYTSAANDDPFAGENVVEYWGFPQRFVEEVLKSSLEDVAVFDMIGDSMVPTIAPGDKVLIDKGNTDTGVPGIFAIHDTRTVHIKRLEQVPATEPLELLLISDNTHHQTHRIPAEKVQVVGRAVCHIARL